MSRLNRKQFGLGVAGAVAAFNIVRAPAKAATFAYKFGTNVPPDDPRSNYRMAMETFLDVVPIPPHNVHRMRGEIDPATAARSSEESIGTRVAT